MKVHAIKVTQNGTTFYETSISAEELADSELFAPDRWSVEANTGYQRDINQRHAAQIGAYLADENETNILPTNIIINSRTPLNPTTIRDNVVEIELTKFPLHVVDGQHRLEGIRKALEGGLDLKRYHLGVTLTNFSLQDEMLHFRNINTRIVRPPKALADILMGRLAEEYGLIPRSNEDQGIIRATKVALALATNSDSPWYGRLALGGQQKRSFHTAVQSSLTRSIAPMFTSGRFNDPNEDLGHVTELFLNFWQALAMVFPEAFADPDHHMIQRYSGIILWHQLFSRILSGYNLNPTREQLYEALSELAKKMQMDSSFWQTKQFYARIPARQTTTPTFHQLTNLLWQELPRDPLIRKTN